MISILNIIFYKLDILIGLVLGHAKIQNYGRSIGTLKEYAHGIKGDVYAVDDTTIFIKGFTYDGTGPDAFFWVGNGTRPSPDGFLVPYPEDYAGRLV